LFDYHQMSEDGEMDDEELEMLTKDESWKAACHEFGISPRDLEKKDKQYYYKIEDTDEALQTKYEFFEEKRKENIGHVAAIYANNIQSADVNEEDETSDEPTQAELDRAEKQRVIDEGLAKRREEALAKAILNEINVNKQYTEIEEKQKKLEREREEKRKKVLEKKQQELHAKREKIKLRRAQVVKAQADRERKIAEMAKKKADILEKKQAELEIKRLKEQEENKKRGEVKRAHRLEMQQQLINQENEKIEAALKRQQAAEERLAKLQKKKQEQREARRQQELEKEESRRLKRIYMIEKEQQRIQMQMEKQLQLDTKLNETLIKKRKALEKKAQYHKLVAQEKLFRVARLRKREEYEKSKTLAKLEAQNQRLLEKKRKRNASVNKRKQVRLEGELSKDKLRDYIWQMKMTKKYNVPEWMDIDLLKYEKRDNNSRQDMHSSQRHIPKSKSHSLKLPQVQRKRHNRRPQPMRSKSSIDNRTRVSPQRRQLIQDKLKDTPYFRSPHPDNRQHTINF